MMINPQTTDPGLARINAIGTILIALTVLIGGGTLMVLAITISVNHGSDPNVSAISTGIIALVTGTAGAVIGHFFGMRASTLGQSGIIAGMTSAINAAPITTVRTPNTNPADAPSNSTVIETAPTGVRLSAGEPDK